MTLVIHKYTIPIADKSYLTTHEGYVPLSVIIQNNQIALYMLVDTQAPGELVRVYVGHEVPLDESLFIGSVQLDGYVWHVFVDKN
jgi:hypothetical protein